MGCGESKHAVATTESISKSKKYNSQKSKKVHNVEVSNDLKVSTIDNSNKSTIQKANNIIPTNTSTTLPDLKQKEVPVKVFNNEDVTNDVEENPSDANKNNLSKVLNDNREEKINELNVVEPCDIQEKESEGDKKELYVESHDDDILHVKQTNSDMQSPPHENIVESPVKEDGMSINLPEVLNDKQEEQMNEVKILEPFVIEEKENERDNEESSANDDTNIESRSQPSEVVVESAVKEDEKSIIDLLNDKHEEQMNIMKDVKPSEIEENENERDSRELSVESHDDQLSIKDNNVENRSPPQENIVDSVVKEDVKPINLTDEQAEVKNENSNAQVLSEAADEVKKEDS